MDRAIIVLFDPEDGTRQDVPKRRPLNFLLLLQALQLQSFNVLAFSTIFFHLCRSWMHYFQLYKVVQIWPGQTVTCLHTNRPGHIWITLYSTKQLELMIQTLAKSWNLGEHNYCGIHDNYFSARLQQSSDVKFKLSHENFPVTTRNWIFDCLQTLNMF
jgi:hypothetical protein